MIPLGFLYQWNSRGKVSRDWLRRIILLKGEVGFPVPLRQLTHLVMFCWKRLNSLNAQVHSSMAEATFLNASGAQWLRDVIFQWGIARSKLGCGENLLRSKFQHIFLKILRIYRSRLCASRRNLRLFRLLGKMKKLLSMKGREFESGGRLHSFATIRSFVIHGTHEFTRGQECTPGETLTRKITISCWSASLFVWYT